MAIPGVIPPATNPVTVSENVTVNGIDEVLVDPPDAPAVLVMATDGRVESTVKVLVELFALTALPVTCAVA